MFSNTYDVNKILPFNEYKWAWNLYETGSNNHWSPKSISMQKDIEDWSGNKLSEDERRLVLRNLGFFSTAESLTANNIVLSVYKHLTVPVLRQYLLRQAYEEAIHTEMFVYCVESLKLDREEIYDAYQTIPSIKEKDDFVVNLTKEISSPDFVVSEDNLESVQTFLRNIIGYYLIMEGIFFYAGFAMMLALKNQKKLTGVGQQFEYTLRDEGVHVLFGVNLINALIAKFPEVWTDSFKEEISNLVRKAVELEYTYIEDTCPRGIFGLNSDSVKRHIRYIADRRLDSIGLPTIYGEIETPFTWLINNDLQKEKNFFETRVTDYKVGGLEDDWADDEDFGDITGT